VLDVAGVEEHARFGGGSVSVSELRPELSRCLAEQLDTPAHSDLTGIALFHLKWDQSADVIPAKTSYAWSRVFSMRSAQMSQPAVGHPATRNALTVDNRALQPFEKRRIGLPKKPQCLANVQPVMSMASRTGRSIASADLRRRWTDTTPAGGCR